MYLPSMRDGILGSCIQPGPASAFATVWGINQQVEDNPFFPLCQYLSNKYMFFFK